MQELFTIENINLNEEDYIYNFQPELTDKLDRIDGDFTQEIINEIVLWKVNRYAFINNSVLELLNKIDKNNYNLDINLTHEILVKLLNTKGIQLAMASTILRFKNPHIYQIIDQRVYRFIYGKNLSLNGLKIDGIIELYINYLIKLKELCEKYLIKFEESDRVLYALDKGLNKNIKIKY